MELQEIRAEIKKLEDELRRVFNQFHDKTGLDIEYVNSIWYSGELQGEERWRKVTVTFKI